MKTISLIAGSLALALMIVAPTLAQENDSKPKPDNQQQDSQQDKNKRQESDEWESRRNPTRAGNLDSATVGTIVRASSLMGMNIQNPEEKGVGEVSDIVLDARTGKIRYVAVTYGGFLGIGNQMHAVPFEAFKFAQDPDDKDATVLVLDITQKQLENSKGFNEDTWPNFADKTFTDKIDARFNIDREHQEGTYTSDRNMKKDGQNDKDKKMKQDSDKKTDNSESENQGGQNGNGSK